MAVAVCQTLEDHTALPRCGSAPAVVEHRVPLPELGGRILSAPVRAIRDTPSQSLNARFAPGRHPRPRCDSQTVQSNSAHPSFSGRRRLTRDLGWGIPPWLIPNPCHRGARENLLPCSGTNIGPLSTRGSTTRGLTREHGKNGHSRAIRRAEGGSGTSIKYLRPLPERANLRFARPLRGMAFR